MVKVSPGWGRKPSKVRISSTGPPNRVIVAASLIWSCLPEPKTGVGAAELNLQRAGVGRVVTRDDAGAVTGCENSQAVRVLKMSAATDDRVGVEDEPLLGRTGDDAIVDHA